MLSNDYPPVTGGIATHIKFLSEKLVKQGVAVHLLVPPADPRPLKEAILYLYNHKSLRTKIARYGYERVTTNFSWDKIAGRTLKFYRRILGTSSNSISFKTGGSETNREIRSTGN